MLKVSNTEILTLVITLWHCGALVYDFQRELSGSFIETEDNLYVSVWSEIFWFVYLIFTKPLKERNIWSLYIEVISLGIKWRYLWESTKQLFSDHTAFCERREKHDFRITVQISDICLLQHCSSSLFFLHKCSPQFKPRGLTANQIEVAWSFKMDTDVIFLVECH